MTLTPPRKKPVKLEWQGGLLDSTAKAASSSGSKVQSTVDTEPEAGAWKGTVKVRREVKGRGGKPVALLCEFKPGASQRQKETLCRALKEKLACGGTVEAGEILVQVDDFARVQKELARLGITATRAGGFS